MSADDDWNMKNYPACKLELREQQNYTKKQGINTKLSHIMGVSHYKEYTSKIYSFVPCAAVTYELEQLCSLN